MANVVKEIRELLESELTIKLEKMPQHILIDDRAEYILICLVKNAVERNKIFAEKDDV